MENNFFHNKTTDLKILISKIIYYKKIEKLRKVIYNHRDNFQKRPSVIIHYELYGY